MSPSVAPAGPRRAPLDNPDLAIKILEEDGGVILTSFTSASDLAAVTSDVAPYLAAPADAAALHFMPPETKRCTRLFGRSQTARELWLQQPALLRILDHFLSTTTVPFDGTRHDPLTTSPILSQAVCMDIGPGAPAQNLHRDDLIWQATHPARTAYTRGDDVGMGILVPGVRTRRANGATLFVPGSHLWGDGHARPEDGGGDGGEAAVTADMETGEAFAFLASAVHAGGGNATRDRRPMYSFFFCRSYIRPEENQHLWWTKGEVEAWSLAAQKMAGYVLDGPYMGHSNHGNPIDMFRASGAKPDASWDEREIRGGGMGMGMGGPVDVRADVDGSGAVGGNGAVDDQVQKMKLSSQLRGGVQGVAWA